MNSPHYRNWRVLCWNVLGLNSAERQRDVRAKIDESGCSIICLQETKCENFDLRLVIKFSPRRFDNFAFSPSVGASGGMIVVWCSSMFHGTLVESNRFAITINFTSAHNAESWTLVSVYGPCQGALRVEFVQWFYDLHIPDDE